MEGARFLALLLYFEGHVEGRGAIAPLKRDTLHLMYSRAPVTYICNFWNPYIEAVKRYWWKVSFTGAVNWSTMQEETSASDN